MKPANLALMLALLLLSSHGWTASSASRSQIAPHYSDLVRSINRQGYTRVIVSTGRQSSGSLPSVNRGASARQAVLDRLASRQLQPLALSRFGNRAVFSVNQAQLDELVSTPGVEQVVEDRLLKPSLASATNLINTAIPHAAGIAGAGITVAILDSGIDGDHEAFGNRIVAEACFSTKYSGFGASHLCSKLSQNGANGQRTDTGPGSAEACTGISDCDHGTHVASIAAGNSATITGVAPQANIIAIQVFSKFTDYEPACGTPTGSCLRTFTSDVMDALDYVASLSGTYNIAAVNLSLGDGSEHASFCPGDSYAFPINSLYNLGIVTAIAAGNESHQNGVASPACVEKAISVGAVRDTDTVPNWSNSDDVTLDMLAPGVSVYAAITNGGYGTKSGTSMATPMVTGALAVLKSQNPALTPAQLTALLADYSWTTSTQVANNRIGNLPQPRLDLGKVFLPRIQINSPTDGATFVDTDNITFIATASDSQDGNLAANVTWSSSLDGAISSPTTLSPGAHTVTATVFDSHGMMASASVNLVVNASDPDSDNDGMDDAWELGFFGDLNQDSTDDFDNDGISNGVEFSNGSNPTDKAPLVNISSPINGTPVANGSTITLSGTASDAEDGNVSANISWSSNLDGYLGTAATLNGVSLSLGVHTVTATVTDSAGGSPLTPAVIQLDVLPHDGDINDDGTVNSADILLLQKHISGQATLPAAAIIRGDLYPATSGDGVLTASDLLLMEKLILGL